MKVNAVEVIVGPYVDGKSREHFQQLLNTALKILNEDTSVNEIIDIKYTSFGRSLSALIILNVNESYFKND